MFSLKTPELPLEKGKKALNLPQYSVNGGGEQNGIQRPAQDGSQGQISPNDAPALPKDQQEKPRGPYQAEKQIQQSGEKHSTAA